MLKIQFGVLMTIANINVGLYEDTHMQRNQITLEGCEIKGLQMST